MKTNIKLYKGEVVLEFDNFKHKYTYKGQEVPSVTKILSIVNKPALISWAAGCAVDSISESINPGQSYDELELQAIMEAGRKAHWSRKVEAGNIGTFLHKWIESYIKGENPGTPVNPGLQESVAKFLGWVEKHNVEFLLSEQMIYSKRYKYAGTLDFVCKIDGKLYLGDTKTSSGIYPEMLVQTAAYRYARQEEFPEEIYAGQLILRIGKDGSFEFARMSDDQVYTLNNVQITGFELYKMMFNGFISAIQLSKVMEDLKTYKTDIE